MRKHAGRAVRHVTQVLLFGVLATGLAHATNRRENWRRVEEIAPGKLVVVESSGRPPEQCRVISVDDASLTCVREPDPNADWRPGDDARVVFPRAAVQSVRGWEDVSDRRLLIRMGIGFAIGALICSEGGPAAAFICAGVGALIGLAASTADMGPHYPILGLPPPNYPVRGSDLRLKLWYQAQRPAAVPVSATP